MRSPNGVFTIIVSSCHEFWAQCAEEQFVVSFCLDCIWVGSTLQIPLTRMAEF